MRILNFRAGIFESITSTIKTKTFVFKMATSSNRDICTKVNSQEKISTDMVHGDSHTLKIILASQ